MRSLLVLNKAVTESPSVHSHSNESCIKLNLLNYLPFLRSRADSLFFKTGFWRNRRTKVIFFTYSLKCLEDDISRKLAFTIFFLYLSFQVIGPMVWYITPPLFLMLLCHLSVSFINLKKSNSIRCMKIEELHIKRKIDVNIFYIQYWLPNLIKCLK